LKPLDSLIAKAMEAHSAALVDYETEKVVLSSSR
jgi:hypothetical protein